MITEDRPWLQLADCNRPTHLALKMSNEQGTTICILLPNAYKALAACLPIGRFDHVAWLALNHRHDMHAGSDCLAVNWDLADHYVGSNIARI